MSHCVIEYTSWGAVLWRDGKFVADFKSAKEAEYFVDLEKKNFAVVHVVFDSGE